MAIDEGARHQLFKRLEETIGEQEASTLMSHLPPVGWADVTTKTDLEVLRAQTAADLHRMESRLLRTVVIANSASILTVGGLAFAAARLV